jgi:hypothetical protein
VRKQYHFWRGEQGLDAWDLDRLIELASALPVEDVDLASIEEIDSVYWFDDHFQRATVRRVVDHVRLIEEVDLSYPIILGFDGRVMDGMHRIAKALLQGRATISAVQSSVRSSPTTGTAARKTCLTDSELLSACLNVANFGGVRHRRTPRCRGGAAPERAICARGRRGARAIAGDHGC